MHLEIHYCFIKLFYLFVFRVSLTHSGVFTTHFCISFYYYPPPSTPRFYTSAVKDSIYRDELHTVRVPRMLNSCYQQATQNFTNGELFNRSRYCLFIRHDTICSRAFSEIISTEVLVWNRAKTRETIKKRLYVETRTALSITHEMLLGSTCIIF
jgi:hypothetical protein